MYQKSVSMYILKGIIINVYTSVYTLVAILKFKPYNIYHFKISLIEIAHNIKSSDDILENGIKYSLGVCIVKCHTFRKSFENLREFWYDKSGNTKKRIENKMRRACIRRVLCMWP